MLYDHFLFDCFISGSNFLWLHRIWHQTPDMYETRPEDLMESKRGSIFFQPINMVEVQLKI